MPLPIFLNMIEAEDAAPGTVVDRPFVEQYTAGFAEYADHVRHLDLTELIAATGEAPAVNQIKWGPRLYDEALVQGHHERGVALEGYSPFKTTRLGDPVLADIADVHNVSPAQVVVRWHIQHGVVVIPKSVTPARIRSNADVFGFELTDDEMAVIDAMGS